MTLAWIYLNLTICVLFMLLFAYLWERRRRRKTRKPGRHAPGEERHRYDTEAYFGGKPQPRNPYRSTTGD